MINVNDTNTRPTPPDGYVECATAVEFPPSVDWDQVDEVRGLIIGTTTAQVTRKEGKVTVRLLLINTADGERALWESAGLCDFFDAVEVGMEILVQSMGTKKLPGKPSPMRIFRAYTRPPLRSGGGRDNLA